MASSLKVNRVVPSTGTNIGLGTASGEIRLAGTSKLTWDGDTNTYINHPSADTIAAFTGNAERLRITSSGKIGIGTNNPATPLHIQSTNPTIRLTDSDQAADNQSWNIAAGNTQILRIQAINDAGGGGGQLFDFYRSGNNVQEFRGMKSGTAWFTVNTNTEKVGIGTNNPNQPVSIASGRVSIDVKSDYYGVWADGDTGGENHISVGRWYNTGGGLKSGYTAYGINNLILETNHPTAAHSLIIQPTGKKVAIGTHLVNDDHLVNVKGAVVADGFVSNGGALSHRNMIHNGEFAVWQRGTTSIYSSQNTYLTDRFKFVSNSEGNGSIHQHTNVPTVAETGGSKFAYSLRLNCTTADTSLANNQYINLSTRIEGQDLRHLGFGEAGTRYATLSFWQRSNSGTYHVSFRNSAYNRYYIASYTATNHTWEKHELTIPVDTAGTWTTNNTSGVDITWSLGGGSWYNQGTVGSWQGGSSHAGSSQKNFFDTVGNDFYITGVQFEKGTIATPFEHKSYGEDLALCQRYFYRAAEGASQALGLGVNYTASEMHLAVTFPVTMRATPQLSAASGTNYYEFIRNGAADWFNSFTLGNRTTNKIGELINSSEIGNSAVVGHGGFVRTDNAAVYVDFVADL